MPFTNMNELSQGDVENRIKNHITNSKNILAETTMVHTSYNKINWTGNMYDITDRLIEIVGRYCDKNASDMLVTLNHLNNCLETNDFDTRYFIFAVRQLGVDGIGYLASRIRDNSNQLSHGYYRKIYAIETIGTTNPIDNSPELKIVLKDISSLSEYDLK